MGDYAFSHKGGVHASAVEKNPSTYEHIDPNLVGNKSSSNHEGWGYGRSVCYID